MRIPGENAFMKRLIQRLFYHYTYNLKLKSKLMISHGVLLLLPTAVVTGFFYARLYTITVGDAIASEQAMAFQAVNSIENLAATAAQTADTVDGTGLVRDLLNPRLVETLEDPLAYEKRMKRLYDLTATLVDGRLITGIRIFCSDSLYQRLNPLNRQDHPLILPLSSRAGSWQDSFLASQDKHMLIPSSQLSEEEKSLGQLAVVNRIYSAPDMESEAFPDSSACVAVYLSQNPFEDSLSASFSLPDSAAYLVNQEGQLVAASAGFSSSFFLEPEKLSEKLRKEQTFSLISLDGSSAYGAYFPIQSTGWYLVSILPSDHITQAGIQLLGEFVLTYLPFTALAVIIALILARSITNRIIGVALQMEHSVRSGKPHPITGRPSGQDEIGVLSDTYNYMVLELNRLMEGEKEAAERLRKAEFRALQAQINPHFLYNTLDMINWLSKTGRTQDVTLAIQALSRFYKLTLSKKTLVGTIREEIEQVTLYIQLQNMRYDNCAQLVVDVPEELSGYTIPKLTFQPLVENALLHGIRMTEQKQGTILITGWQESGDIVFIISDDGAGMDQETLDDLSRELEQPAFGEQGDRGPERRKQSQGKNQDGKRAASAKGSEAAPASHIGIYNTHMRLKSLYGTQYGLTYESQPHQGTQVTIRLAARRESQP